MDQSSTPSYEFEGFRLDTVLQVLSSPAGEPVALPSRAFETLRYLVERAGELVEKSTLMKAVWPRAMVEENNLNQCIFTLRKVLGEAAGERRFILTVPGRGFKFVAPVTVIANAHRDLGDESGDAVSAAAASVPTLRRGGWRSISITLAAVGIAAVAVAIARFAFPSRSLPVTSPAEYQSLTDASDSATAPALSPDGHMLAFIKGGDVFISPGQIWLKLLPDGEAIQLTHAAGLIFAPAFTPDGTHVAFSTVNKDLSNTWDTWTVPINGGEPAKLLPNASGLSFIGPHQVMYSEFKSGLHLGIVASRDDRSEHHEIYLPSHERGMAHFSYLSPDRQSVLVVEMDRTGSFRHCRLVPFDGSSPGRAVGPDGSCLSAAWSPRGEWMYFAAVVAGRGHIWRQRFSDSQPQQITFGPTDEETVVCAADGRSLLTSLGRVQSTIWLHKDGSERILTTESVAYAPWLSPDANRVYFLAARDSTQPSELWRVDVASGSKELLLSGVAIGAYDISSDERQVVFAAKRNGAPQVWIAPLDRHTPPSLLVGAADQAVFDGAGNIFFRSLGEHANFLHRIKADGSENVRVFDKPITELHGVAPNGQLAGASLGIDGAVGGEFLVPIGGGTPYLLREGWWPSQWSRDGKVLYIEVGAGRNSQRHGRTAALSLGANGLPIESSVSVAETTLIPQAETNLAMGSDRSVYALVKEEIHRNIYRIPLHD
jgi:DNA-binding winged helix-turn-helix (wHTH) protein/Tol biopolymer transport system component